MTEARRRAIVIDELPTAYLPYEVGTLHMDPEGRLTVTPGETSVRFRFSFEDVRFSALARRDETAGSLRLCGALGTLPYSAESVPARRDALEAMRKAAAMTQGHFVVSEDQSILYLGTMEVALPFTPVMLLTHLTLGLIELKPHIARVRAALGAPVEAAAPAPVPA